MASLQPKSPLDFVEAGFCAVRLLRRPQAGTEDVPPVPDETAKEAVELATEIVVRGVEWRDRESMRLADRAGTLLAAGSIVIGVGSAAAFRDGAHSIARWFLVASLSMFIVLALAMILALRPRVMPRRTGYALETAWADIYSLHREHQRHLRAWAEVLDCMTYQKAQLIELGGVLLTLETVALTGALIVQIWL